VKWWAGYALRSARELLALLREKLFGGAVTSEACDAILGWVATLALPPGAARELEVPDEVASLKGRRVVHALRTADGRYFVLLKSVLGWKGNFEGTLCCDKPLRPDELVGAQGQRPYISVGSVSPWQELYVRGRLSERRFKVYFDLN
jgi:hypothetical protein